jgi:predicted GIY-YIG superfamily endonuclease
LLAGPTDTFVYFGYSQGEVVYVGITRNLARRQAQHEARFVIQPITSNPLTRRQARAIEQAYIEAHKDLLQNKRNSIAKTRDWYREAVNWGNSWLKAVGFI